MPIKKVFLSSTTKDLEEYRNAASIAIDGLDGYRCVHMGAWGARDHNAADFCRAQVIECNLFVGIIGHLYGECPDKSDISYTELEYNAAIGADISRLIFIAPETFSYPHSIRESDEKQDKQKIFRNRIGKDRIESKFNSAEELASEIKTAIHNWEREQKAIRIPFQAPPLPEHFVPRTDESNRLKARLLGCIDMTSGILVISAIHGLGGIGKTILATVLANDPDVKNRFSDGILWATLGQQPDILSLLSSWIQELGDYEFHPTTSNAATLHLRTLLQDKSVLLIVDDAWNIGDVEPFLISGSKCQILITTRIHQIARAVNARSFELDVMTEEQSLLLLSNRLNRRVYVYDEKLASKLAKSVGFLPLALDLAASQVEEGVSWSTLIDDLQVEVDKLKALEMPDVQEIDESKRRYLSLKACFKLSLQRLPKLMINNFAWLGVLPEDVLLNQKMIATLWKVSERTAGDNLRYLRGKSLLLSGPSINESLSTYRLHDLLLDLARNLLVNPVSPSQGELPGLGLKIQDAHSIFIDRYLEKSQENNFHTIPDDDYIHNRLLWHLEKAGRIEEIHDLLKQETEESRNAWYEARDRLGQISGFLEDIARAWRLAEDASRSEIKNGNQSKKIGYEIRYALVTASVNSLASSVPAKILSAMVKTNLWTPAQGLAYARHVLDLKHRDEALRSLSLCLSRPEEALVAAREINDTYKKSKALLKIAINLSGPQRTERLNEALAIVAEINDKNKKNELLEMIALNLTDASYALQIAREIDLKSRRSEIIAEISQKLPEPQKTKAISEAIYLARELTDDVQKSEALASIAPNISNPSEALLILQEIKDGDRLAEALARIARSLKGDLLKEAVEIAMNINTIAPPMVKKSFYNEMILDESLAKNQKAKALALIAFNIIDTIKALEIAEEIQDDDRRDEIMAKVALNMSEHNLQDAIDVSKRITNANRKAECIKEIIMNLSNPQDMVMIAGEIRVDLRASLISMISLNLPEPEKRNFILGELQTYKTIPEGFLRATALVEIASSLPKKERIELQNDILNLINKLNNKYQKAELLAKIAVNLPGSRKMEILKELCSLVKDIQPKDPKLKGLLMDIIPGSSLF